VILGAIRDYSNVTEPNTIVVKQKCRLEIEFALIKINTFSMVPPPVQRYHKVE